LNECTETNRLLIEKALLKRHFAHRTQNSIFRMLSTTNNRKNTDCQLSNLSTVMLPEKKVWPALRVCFVSLRVTR